MTPYIWGFLYGIACFVVGFFVGKKHGYKLAELEVQLKDTLGKK